MIKKNEITGEIIGKYFLTKDNLTQKKVSKLVFYAYLRYIALNNELKLFYFIKYLKPGYMIRYFHLFMKSINIIIGWNS